MERNVKNKREEEEERREEGKIKKRRRKEERRWERKLNMERRGMREGKEGKARVLSRWR